MARRSLYFVAALVLSTGCGESPMLSPAEQALREVRAGHYDVAIATSSEGIRLNPRDAKAYQARGRAYQLRNKPGDVEAAIADFTESIRFAPTDPEAYYSRSIVYRDQGDNERFEADQTKARDLDAELKDVYAQLADLTPPNATPSPNSGPPDDAASAEEAEAAKARAEGALGADEIPSALRLRDPLAPDKSTGDSFAPGRATKAHPQEKYLPLLTAPQFTLPDAEDDPAPNRNPRSDDPPTARRATVDKPGAPRRPPAENPRRNTRRQVSPSWPSEPAPMSPFQRGQSAGLRELPPSAYQRPVQSPFPQAPPRPTGFVQPQPQGPLDSQPRQTFNNPYSPPPPSPLVHPPGAYHEDFNP